jgi:hypothetical protein
MVLHLFSLPYFSPQIITHSVVLERFHVLGIISKFLRKVSNLFGGIR